MRALDVQKPSTAFEEITPDAQFGRRRHVRYNADTSVLFIAPTQSFGEVPRLSAFFPVRCNDLSRGGFSFFFPAPPEFGTLIVQLGNRRSCLYMEAEVVHFSAIKHIPDKSAWDIHGREYESRFDSAAVKVGCQFLKRVSPPCR